MSMKEIFFGLIPALSVCTLCSVSLTGSLKLMPVTGNEGLSPHCKQNLFRDLIGMGRGKEICFINQ